ncbi:hypothetical protein F4780DRAFT_2368 [Xylariomycetidae sp. FL0641]|nr:hypothetical protein F4780DRAFT_2368 [Xylariomycetidae sp. FL0641]
MLHGLLRSSGSRMALMRWASSPLLCLPILVGAISPISTHGTKLFDEDGSQFFVKGVVYQRGNTDPLADTDQCQTDAGLMKAIDINTVFVYFSDSSKDHHGCMQAFESQGIYVWLGLASLDASINSYEPAWTKNLYESWSGVVDAFAAYDNLLSFSIGNEIITSDVDSTATAPYVKAAIRDIRAYRDARGYRHIPISYVAADSSETRLVAGQYLTCGDSTDTVEMYGLNIYSWCGNSSYYKSGYDKLYEQFQSFNVPVLFSETGCIEDERDFSDVETMLGPVFQSVFSGAAVYEWTQAENGYGIVEYPDDNDYTGFPLTLSDYNALSSVLKTANPPGTSKSDYTPSNTPPACPTSASSWLVDADGPLPTIAHLDIATVSPVTTYTQVGSGSAPAASATSTGANADGLTDPSGTLSRENGVSGGAVAGIVIGVVAALGLLATSIFLVVRRRRRGQQAANASEIAHFQETQGLNGSGGLSTSNTKAELPAVSAARVIPRQEMDALQHPRADVSPSSPPGEVNPPLPAEVSAEPVLYEMDGSPIRYHEADSRQV